MLRSNDMVEKELKLRRESIKPINDRIRRLREESIKAEVRISIERAKLLTEFYMSDIPKGHSIPVQRALAFKYLMENVSIPVEDGQLIVGIRGTGIKEVPTYPEICCHTIEDLLTLSAREKNPYKVDGETLVIYRDLIIPFWKGRTMRDMIFKSMSEEWMKAYRAGIFTEFMEQRVPGHTAGGERIYKMGLLDIKDEIQRVRRSIDTSDPDAYDKLEELKAMEIVADGMMIYARRYAEKLKRMASEELDPERRLELEEMAEICSWVPAHAPRTFWEALQHYWFIHVGILYESNPWDSFNPGKLDQHLYPFYKRDLESGRLTRERAIELLQAFWIKFNNQPAPPKVGVTAEESNTYNDFSKPNIGGMTRDGKDAVNELSYLILEVHESMRLLQPNLGVLISERNPDSFLIRALEVVKPGFGEPAFYNHDGVVTMLLRQGKSLEDARDGGCSGCVESGAWGREAYILTGYLNLPKILEITLNMGIDPRTGEKIGIDTPDPRDFKSFDELLDAFREQLSYFVKVKISGNNIIESLYAKFLPVPFLSLWIEDCVKNARDYNAGGARYNTEYIHVVGLGTLTDSLVSLKYNVFEMKRYTMDEVLDALIKNYEGYEEMRQVFINKTPKYGNDDDYADDVARYVLDECVRVIEGHPPTPIRKASRRLYAFPTTVHIYFGKLCGATPDGRKAGMPLSEGISPVQGMDRNGLAAMLRSVGKLDHAKTGGTLLNAKLSPDLLEDEEILVKLAKLIRAYFRMGGHHIQFNVVSAELLRRAQENPDEFRDLMVRVAGYSDYFVNLPKALQDEIIARTEHRLL